MVDFERLYARLPRRLQDAACSLEGMRIQHRRLGRRFPEVLREVEARAALSPDELVALRDARLRRFAVHAMETVPFYRRRFAELGVEAGDIAGLDDLVELPVLTKAEVQDAGDELLSEAVAPRHRVMAHTSGTTGGGLRFSTTNEALREQWAVWWRYWRWHGIAPAATWCGYFVGRPIVPIQATRPPFWRINRPQHRVLFSAYHMSETNLPAYVDELRRRRLAWIHGYPSTISLVAANLLERGETIGYPVRWVTTGAENLLPQQARLIEAAFGAAPRQHYGMAEAVANASQCESGRLHVDEDFAGVELVRDDDGRVKVVGTNFSNPATPLLRYEVGDHVELLDGDCPCGRGGRLLAGVDGRLEDYVLLKNGARIGRLDHIFKDRVRIREAQIYQAVPGAVTLRVVKGPRYVQDDETQLLYETRKRLGEDADITIEYMDEIPRRAGGKLRFVTSDVGTAKIFESP